MNADIKKEIEAALDQSSSGSIEIRFDGGKVTIPTERMSWWRNSAADDIRSLADRLALVAEDPTMLLGVTNTGDWRKESEGRRARRPIKIEISPELRLATVAQPAPRPQQTAPAAIDILMPVKEGAYIRGDVVRGLLSQDMPIRWYVAGGPDLEVGAREMDLFGPATPSPFWRRHVYRMLKILAKRNRLLSAGDSPLVYFADADVRIPPGVFGALAQALLENESLGATGLIYQVDMPHYDSHLTAGSMMLRRSDLPAIGPLRGGPCECSFIRSRLAELGKVVIAVESVHAHQWKRTILDDTRVNLGDEEESRLEVECPRCGEARNALPEQGYKDVFIEPQSDGSLSIPELFQCVERYGEAFRVFLK